MLARFYISILFMALIQGVFAQVDLVQENQAGISRRLQFEIDITKDPKIGFVPKYRLVNAYQIKEQKIREARERRLNQGNTIMDPTQGGKPSSTSTSGSTTTPITSAAIPEQFGWIERGPFKDAVGPSNGNTRTNSAITSGRVRAIWEDLRDATGNTVWVGGIDGGLWKTTDFSATAPTWTFVDDKFNNMAISSICQDPTNPLILYFGTGEKTINADAVRGAGVWTSIDGGITWSIMPSTANFWNISKVACDKDGNLYVGCNALNNTSGLQRFTKATSSWVNITPSGLDPRIPDFEISSNNKLHVSCGYYNTSASLSGYRFTSTPATVSSSTWTRPTSTFPTQYNVDIASNGDVLYALSSDASWQIPKIYKSTNGGVNWTATSRAPASGWASAQAWYSMAITINPMNVNQVLVGGLDCHRTTDGGSTWKKVSVWVGSTGQYVHADQHIMFWNKSNRIIVGNDGGVFASTDGGTTFRDKNTGLRIKQFYSVAIHPNANTDYFIGGTQDNGMHQIKSGGLAPSIEVTGGDGAFAKIDQDQPQFQWGSYVYNQYRRSVDGGNTWTSINYSSSSGRFINPIDYDNTRNLMYCSGTAGTFLVWSNPQSGSTFTSATLPTTVWNGGTVSAVKVSPYAANTVFFAGGGSGFKPSLVRVDNADATTRTFKNIILPSMQVVAGSNISSINVGKTDNEIIVTFSNYGVDNIWVTYDGGASWSAIDGNLPDMPVRWSLFHPDNSKQIIIATETGVWQTTEALGISTLWYPEDKFPNVRVDMLEYRKSDRLIAAATHGRGIFTATIPGGSTSPSCGIVTGLSTSSVTTISAIVNWSALSGATGYDVDFAVSGSSTWTNAATGITNLSTTISGLSAATTYVFRVRANCNGILGSYSESTFQTTSSTTICNAPTGLNATNITASSATLNWSSVSGAVNYTVEYKANASTTWNIAGASITGLSVNISGLSASTLYDYRVKANCSSTNSSVYTNAQFTSSAPTTTTCESFPDGGSNETYLTSTPISVNLNYNGLISTSTDRDYYSFNITKIGSVTINLTTLPANYQITLFSTNGTTKLKSSNKSGTSNEAISYSFTATGKYYILVQGVSGSFNASNCYTLKITTGTAAGTIQEIATGNSMNTSNRFATNEIPVQSFKLFPNPAQDKLTIYMVSDNSSKSMQLFNTKGALIYTQKLSEMFTTLDVHKLTPGIYFVRIMGENGKVVHQEKILKH